MNHIKDMDSMKLRLQLSPPYPFSIRYNPCCPLSASVELYQIMKQAKTLLTRFSPLLHKRVYNYSYKFEILFRATDADI